MKKNNALAYCFLQVRAPGDLSVFRVGNLEVINRDQLRKMNLAACAKQSEISRTMFHDSSLKAMRFVSLRTRNDTTQANESSSCFEVVLDELKRTLGSTLTGVNEL